MASSILGRANASTELQAASRAEAVAAWWLPRSTLGKPPFLRPFLRRFRAWIASSRQPRATAQPRTIHTIPTSGRGVVQQDSLPHPDPRANTSIGARRLEVFDTITL
jgi:hypothetical protein